MQNNELDKHFEDLRHKQRNVLPPDVISNDRDVNDVLWNGSPNKSGVQRVGAFVTGAALALGGLSIASTMWRDRFWIGMVPAAAIGGAGSRVVYKSLRPSQSRSKD